MKEHWTRSSLVWITVLNLLWTHCFTLFTSLSVSISKTGRNFFQLQHPMVPMFTLCLYGGHQGEAPGSCQAPLQTVCWEAGHRAAGDPEWASSLCLETFHLVGKIKNILRALPQERKWLSFISFSPLFKVFCVQHLGFFSETEFKEKSRKIANWVKFLLSGWFF